MNGVLRAVFLVYFISHIPITICVDLQALFGAHYPEVLRNLFAWYLSTYHDFLMETAPIWLKSIIWIELCFQLPFFFVAAYGFLYKKNWIRIPSIVYGAHVATTVVPLLGEIAFSPMLKDSERLPLIGFYTPYLLIPAVLCWYMCFNKEPFGPKPKRS